eukprot:4892957-Alexandrium_andersonii.AAC.1
MAACAAALAASGNTHPVSFVLDRHDERKEAQGAVRTAAASGGFASAAQVIRQRVGSRAPPAVPAAAAQERVTLRSRSPLRREREQQQPQVQPQPQESTGASARSSNEEMVSALRSAPENKFRGVQQVGRTRFDSFHS